jgi:hypothetical protein
VDGLNGRKSLAGPGGSSSVKMEWCRGSLGGYVGGLVDAQCMHFCTLSLHDHTRHADGSNLLGMHYALPEQEHGLHPNCDEC